MKFLYSVFFLIMYAIGWSLVFIPSDYVLPYVFGTFLVVNLFTIFNQNLFSKSVLRPLQLSYASILVFSFLNDNYSYGWIATLLFVGFIVMDWEDFKYIKNKKVKGWKRYISYSFQFAILPFSVTYCVMIFRPSMELFEVITMILYFTVLFFSAKYLVSKRLVVMFVVTQIFGFTYVMGKYYVLEPTEIIMFIFSVLGILVINQGRKGLLEYLEK